MDTARRGREKLVLAAAALVGATLAGCGAGDPQERELAVRKAELEREVQGLEQVEGRLGRGEPVIAPEDVAVVVDQGLVRELLAAQLPAGLDIGAFRVLLETVDVQFSGVALVRLRGAVSLRATGLQLADVTVSGGLRAAEVDPASGRLRARVVVDDVRIGPGSGLGRWLTGPTRSTLAHALRERSADVVPQVQIPVRFRRRLDLPALTDGPVRISGGALPVQVAVSTVLAGHGRLWIGVSVHPGRVAQPDAGGESAAAEDGA